MSETFEQNRNKRDLFPGLFGKSRSKITKPSVDREIENILNENRGMFTRLDHVYPSKYHWDWDSMYNNAAYVDPEASEPLSLEFIVCERRTGNLNSYLADEFKKDDHKCVMRKTMNGGYQCPCGNGMYGGKGASSSSSSSSSGTQDNESSSEENKMVLSNSTIETSDLEGMKNGLFSVDTEDSYHNSRINEDIDIDDFESDEVYDVINNAENGQDERVYTSDEQEILDMNDSIDTPNLVRRKIRKNTKYTS